MSDTDHRPRPTWLDGEPAPAGGDGGTDGGGVAAGFGPAEGTEGAPAGLAWPDGGVGTVPRGSWWRLALILAAVAAGTLLFGWYVFAVIGALVVSIVLHEFGHYWTARRCGMKATEFFVGFGPRLWSFRRGETEYGLKLIPAGAYVRIIGMNNLEEVDPAEENRTYRSKGTFKRLAVVLAGPAMNLLLAFLVFTAVFALHGRSDPEQWRVDEVGPGTAAAAAGIRVGDRILAVDGEPVTTFDSLRTRVADSPASVTLRVERDGQQLDVPVDLRWRLTAAAAAAVPSQPPVTRGDLMVALDGQPVTDYESFRRTLGTPGPPVTLRIERQDHPYEVTLTRPVNLPETGSARYLGVRGQEAPVPEPLPAAAWDSIRTMADAGVATGAALGKLFTPSGIESYVSNFSTSPTAGDPSVQPGTLVPVAGSPPLTQLQAASGESTRPVSIIGIVWGGSETLQSGIWSFLALLAGVNLVLALINLLPLPPFDGGHAAVAAYEGVRGRLRGEPYRADMTKLLPIVYPVILVLVLLGASAMFLDVTQHISFAP